MDDARIRDLPDARVRGQKSEVRSQKSEVRSQETGAIEAWSHEVRSQGQGPPDGGWGRGG
jgi:hypothetical protein